MSKFAETVKDWGVTPEQIVAASKAMEVRSAEDRELATSRRQARQQDKKLSEANIAKPALGRALTLKSVQQAIAGSSQSRIVRSKLVRALNQLAKAKKKTAVDAISLFGETKRRRGQPPVKKGPGKK
jgi:hypothetical protein